MPTRERECHLVSDRKWIAQTTPFALAVALVLSLTIYLALSQWESVLSKTLEGLCHESSGTHRISRNSTVTAASPPIYHPAQQLRLHAIAIAGTIPCMLDRQPSCLLSFPNRLQSQSKAEKMNAGKNPAISTNTRMTTEQACFPHARLAAACLGWLNIRSLVNVSLIYWQYGQQVARLPWDNHQMISNSTAL